MTIGTSAPPTGKHQQHAERQPDQAEQDADPQLGSATSRTLSTEHDGDQPPPKAIGRPGKITGRVVISSCSLANVTSEPAKLTDPTRMVKAVATRSKVGYVDEAAPR